MYSFCAGMPFPIDLKGGIAMNMVDFWENVTASGFAAATIEDFKELFRQIKDEAIELLEEGQELFTDGFREMVIKNNSGDCPNPYTSLINNPRIF